MNHIQQTRPLSTERMVDGFLAQTFALERQAVVAGWFAPIELYDAAHARGLRGDMYGDSQYGFLHSYICHCAECGKVPDVDQAVDVGRGFDFHLWPIELLDLLLGTDYHVDNLDDYVYGVTMMAHRREKARELQREYYRLTEGVSIDGTPKATHTSAHGLPLQLRGRIVA